MSSFAPGTTTIGCILEELWVPPGTVLRGAVLYLPNISGRHQDLAGPVGAVESTAFGWDKKRVQSALAIPRAWWVANLLFLAAEEFQANSGKTFLFNLSLITASKKTYIT